jgi:hypothetical protein
VHPVERDDLARFRLLASAIAGRWVDIAPASASKRAWTDGTTIFVDAGNSPRDLVRTIAVQASLLREGSLAAPIVGRLARRSALTRRYLAVEGHRALAAQEDLLPAPARSLLERTIALRSDSPASSLMLAASNESIADAPVSFGAIHPRRVRASADPAPRRAPNSDIEDLDDLGDLDEEPDGGPTLQLSSPVGGGGAIGRLLARMFGAARSSSGGPAGADAPTHKASRGTRGAVQTGSSTMRAAENDRTGLAESWSSRYPEWDVHHRSYRPDWCTVIEIDAKRDERAASLPTGAAALRRALARLGVGLERRHRQMQGDDIDVDAAVEARVEMLAGSAPDDAVYIDIVRARRDLSVLLLLDVSGSAAEPGATGTMVHEHQRDAAAALAVALHDLGDRVALYGFRSQGRSAVQIVPVMRFDDALDASMFRRLGGLTPGAYTRLGAAIRHGASVLEEHGGTSRRLLVVISDGLAYDHGYEGAYAEADARRALAEARRRGVGCLCLSVGVSSDAQALRRVFGTAAHATIPRAEQLPDVVAPLFRSALRSSEEQRRMSQRRERTRERLQIDGKAG